MPRPRVREISAVGPIGPIPGSPFVCTHQRSEHMATSRARFLKALWAVLLIGTLSLGGLTVALAQDSRIEPSTLGEMPTTGGLRPGPANAQSSTVTPAQQGVIPVAIQIPNAFVDAQVETNEIIDGVMQDPTGPWVISWYK